jgi:YgiT-type zinc finger domain-containing protein
MAAKYKYDDCTFCGGRVTERRIQKPCFWGDKLIALIDRVPTGVCEQCGERYYRAPVLKRIEAKLKARRFARRIRLPIIEYSART